MRMGFRTPTGLIRASLAGYHRDSTEGCDPLFGSRNGTPPLRTPEFATAFPLHRRIISVIAFSYRSHSVAEDYVLSAIWHCLALVAFAMR
jgi:hypothetical protein